jgi:DNA invertase Pin-like site-specific DNA recombinase
MSKQAAIYCRISADSEGRELGVERQRQDCERLAERLGLEIVQVYVDNDISASTRSKKVRPAYRQMIQDARAGAIQAIVAYSTSRLTRKPREAEDLLELVEQHRIRFHYVASPDFDLNTAAGRHVARLLAAGDAAEAEQIAERVTRQKLQAATEGRWRGGSRPFGYGPDGMTIREVEATELRAAAAAVLAGRSLRSIVADWNRRGVKTPAGNRWDAIGLSRALTRPRTGGFIEHRGEILGKAAWEPILDEATWRGVRAILSDPSRRTTPGPGRRWLLSGIGTCGVCGGPLVGSTGGNSKHRHPAYRCGETRSHVSRHAPSVDAFVAAVVVERLRQPDAADLLAPRDAPTADRAAQRAALSAREREAADLFTSGLITAAQLAHISADIIKQTEDLDRLDAVDARESTLRAVRGADPQTVWDSLDLDQRRSLVQIMMRVVVRPAKRGRPAGWTSGQSYFDAESIEIIWRTE